MQRFLYLFILFIGLNTITFAQAYKSSNGTSIAASAAKPPIVRRPPPITKELSAGFRLNTDGWSLIVESGKAKTEDTRRIDMFHDVRILQFEFSERRHPKELRIYGMDGAKQSDKMYSFGKLNNFYSFKFNYGYRKMIAGKPYPKAVSVHWVYAGGLTIGLLKPYYVDAYVSKDNGSTYERESIKNSPENSLYFLNTPFVIGSSGFSKGLGEIKIVPGLHLKTALHFDYTPNKFNVAAIEVGATGEFYTSKIELMANQKAVPYFFNLYAGIQFGKRSR